MSKCFITKYLGSLSTSDEEAVYYDSIVLKVPVVTDGSYESSSLKTESKEPNIKWLSGGRVDITEDGKFGKKVKLADNETEPAYVKISPIYDITELVSYHGNLVIPSQLERLHKVKLLRFTKEVDLSFLSGLTSLTTLYLSGSITGDIANLRV